MNRIGRNIGKIVGRPISGGYGTTLQEYLDYLNRVVAGGGSMQSNLAYQVINFLKQNDKLAATELLIGSLMGGQTRESGVQEFFSKLYSADTTPNDAAQTTELSQPGKVGLIAPNELPAMYNGNGETKHMTHPPIRFESNEAWWCRFVFNANLKDSGDLNTLTDARTVNYWNIIRFTKSFLYLFTGNVEDISIPFDFAAYSGKSIVMDITANGLGSIEMHINGTYIGAVNQNTATEFKSLLVVAPSTNFAGRLYYYHILSGDHSAFIPSYHAFLRTLIPEIESVQIGAQEWATSNLDIVCTPEGNVIPEVQDAATWITAQTLFDNAYAAEPGTTAEKEYAGYKAAAMWCHYNNDAANGAIYGKLYNWFAAKLLDIDMASSGYGWHVPTEAEFNTIATTLGGESVAGGKMKKEGTDYWDSPNTGATNESGFTAIGAGRRTQTGGYTSVKFITIFWSSSNYDSENAKRSLIDFDNAAFSVLAFPKLRGYSIRLIKD